MKVLLKKNRRFCIMALIWGALFTFLIPLWQVPDEYEHLKMIGKEIKNEYLAEALLEDVPLDEHRIRWNQEEKIDVRILMEVMFKKAGYQKNASFPKGISIKIVRHFPATFGLLIGIWLGLPTYWVLIVGRLFSLMFYITVCTISLELIPLEKELFEIILLLPMCIQEVASLSYDAVLMPMCFLVIAYALYLKFTAPKIGMRDVLIFMGSILCIALIKPPYIVLGGVILIVPLNKVHIKIGRYVIAGETINKLKWPTCTVILAAAGTVIYCGRNNTWIKLVEATFLHFPRTVWLFGRTCKVWGTHIFESMV